MKVLVIVKATKESEAGRMPDEKIIAEMGQFKDEPRRARRHNFNFGNIVVTPCL